MSMPMYRVEGKAFVWCEVEARNEDEALLVGGEELEEWVAVAGRNGVIEIGFDDAPFYVEDA